MSFICNICNKSYKKNGEWYHKHIQTCYTGANIDLTKSNIKKNAQ